MKTFVRLSDRLSTLFGYISVATLIVILLMIVMEMFLRTVLDKTLFITDEYIGYLCALMAYFGFGYTLMSKGHVRVTMAIEKMSPKNRNLIDVLAACIAFVAVAAMSVAAVRLFWSSVVQNSTSMAISMTPLKYPHFLAAVGVIGFNIQVAAEACRAYIRFKEGVAGELESSSLGR